MRRPASRLGVPVLSALLVLGATTTATATHPTEPGPSRVDLERPARGAVAVRLLGDQLEAAAATNGMSASRLAELLTTDPSAWVDTAGAVFFEEASATAPGEDPVAAEAPLDQTFLLHSKPGSSKTIFLDFDGGSASATAWHVSYPTTPTTQPAWDPSGNGAAFNDGELASIQAIWQAVAEDYAPFDVDVTTSDPGAAGIHRSSSNDTTYGSHVLITPSAGAQQAICSGACGGVAYIDVFDTVNGNGWGPGGDGYGYLQPAWVFPQSLGNSPKNIAEAAAHEVGHNFGLEHDANPTQGYDRGHGAWAPIMGVGYDHPISQWSKGDYTGATNQQDDVAVIRSVAGSREDEAPATIVGAPRLPAGTAYVTSRADVDTYLLGACSGAVSVTASPLPSLANLDIGLTLRNGLGDVVATIDPPSAQTSTSIASGLGASASLNLGSGLYYASVDGVGSGTWSTGYDDYGSLGAYTISASGCDSSVLPTATATDLVASAAGRTVTLSASPTTTLGTLVGEVVFREAGTVVGSAGLASPTVSLTSVTPGTHTYTASFVPSGTSHAGSTSPPRSVTVQVASSTTLIPTVAGQDVTLAVQVGTDGGSPAGSVELREGSTLVGTVPLSGATASLTLTSVTPGDHAYQATFVPADPSSYVGSVSAVRSVTVAEPVVTPTPVVTPPATPPPVVTSPTVTPPVTTPPAPLAASTTSVKAPRKATAGSRPTITVKVTRGSAAATGRVAVTVGKKTTTLSLASGSAKLKLPRLKKGKVTVTVRYLGDATTSGSSATRTIKVTA